MSKAFPQGVRAENNPNEFRASNYKPVPFAGLHIPQQQGTETATPDRSDNLSAARDGLDDDARARLHSGRHRNPAK